MGRKKLSAVADLSGAGALAAGSPAAFSTPRTGTEKAVHSRILRKERAFKRIMGGGFIYKIKHELGQKWETFEVQPWLQDFVREFCADYSFRAMVDKGRQIYQTTTSGIIILDKWLFEPGTTTLIENRNKDEAHTTLITKVWEPWCAIAPFDPNRKDNGVCRFSERRIVHFRDGGGNSVVIAGEGKFGNTPHLTLATEFPIMAMQDEARARVWLSGGVTAGQHGDHILEGTGIANGVSALWEEMRQAARDRQRRGYKRLPDQWEHFFVPWFAKTILHPITDEQWKGHKHPAEVLDYFATIEDKSAEIQIGNKIWTGGYELSEIQKRWFTSKYLGEQQRNWARMFADYPGLIEDMNKTGGDRFYLKDEAMNLRHSPRWGDFAPIYGRRIHCATDWGWQDETVMIYFQMDENGVWRVLDCDMVKRFTMPEVIARLRAWDAPAKSGRGLLLHLPHDTVHSGGTIAAMETGKDDGRGHFAKGVTIRGELEAAGFQCHPTWSRPSGEAEYFDLCRKTLQKLVMNRSTCAPLLTALETTQREEDNMTQTLKDKLRRTKSKHFHDAYVLLSRMVSMVEMRAAQADGAEMFRALAAVSRGNRLGGLGGAPATSGNIPVMRLQ